MKMIVVCSYHKEEVLKQNNKTISEVKLLLEEYINIV